MSASPFGKRKNGGSVNGYYLLTICTAEKIHTSFLPIKIIMKKTLLVSLHSSLSFLQLLTASSLNSMKKYLLIVTTALLFLSCYSTTEVEMPNDASFLVVNSVNFQSDSTWLIEVSKSSTYLNNNDFVLEEPALVTIEDGEANQIQLTPVSFSDRIFYKSNQKPEAGKRYELKINIPGFQEVRAKSEIPEPVQIEHVVIDSTILRDAYDFYQKNGNYGPYEGQTINCYVSFRDSSSIKNYYQLKLYRETEEEYIDLNGNLVKRYFFIESGYYLDKDGRTSFMIANDELFNGTLYTWDVQVPISAFYDFKYGTQENNNFKLKLHFTLRHLSKDYYNYFETRQLQDIRNGDPFAQPVIVHTNIVNGAGIFAGFSQSVFTLSNQRQ